VLCVVGIFRHGDRTPKQKIKMGIESFGRGSGNPISKLVPFFLQLSGQSNAARLKEIKIKSSTDLQALLNMIREITADYENPPPFPPPTPAPDVEEEEGGGGGLGQSAKLARRLLKTQNSKPQNPNPKSQNPKPKTPPPLQGAVQPLSADPPSPPTPPRVSSNGSLLLSPAVVQKVIM